jgi:hypothetical protein
VIAPGELKVVEVVGPKVLPSRAVTPGVRTTAGAEAIAPVARAGVTGPNPSTKTVITEPAIAGLVQSFNVPSALRATAAAPKAITPPHTVYPGYRLPDAAGVRKTLGCRSTTPSVKVSDSGSGVRWSITCICTVDWPSIS